MTRREQAMAYFKQGFNCSQSVLRAYSDLFDMPEDELMKAGQSFGGGMGRLRLVCGRPGSAPWLVLAEGRKGGRPSLQVEGCLYTQGADGAPDPALNGLYKPL